MSPSPMLTAEQICWTPFIEPLSDLEPARRVVAAAASSMGETAPQRALAYEDLVVRDLADGEAEARERVVVLEADDATLRDMLHECLARLASESAHLEASRRTIQTLRHAERQCGTAKRAA